MRQYLLKASYVLTGLLILLMALQTLWGLLRPELYQDQPFVKAAWFGNDLVTLLLAVPLLLASWLLTLKGSVRGHLIWLGMLAYTVYNYAFYVFGSVQNAGFLLYVALFTCATYALIFGLISLDLKEILPIFSHTIPARRISGYLFLWGLLLCGIWIVQSVNLAYTSQLPQIVVDTALSSHLTAILDLWLMVPVVFLSAVLLWFRQTWGIVLGTMINVKGAVYALVLVAGASVGYSRGMAGQVGQIPLWLFLSLASLVCCFILLSESKKALVEQELDFPEP